MSEIGERHIGIFRTASTNFVQNLSVTQRQVCGDIVRGGDDGGRPTNTVVSGTVPSCFG